MTRNLFQPNQTDALESRLGMRMAAALSERNVVFPHDLNERLRVAREQALGVARDSRRSSVAAIASPAVIGSAGGSVSLGGGPNRWWLRLASVAPMMVLGLGLLLVQYWSDREQVLAAAAIDAVLLADDLPPTAYSDPGFREFLKSPPP